MGYEAMREETLARQKELGIVPNDTELPPINPIGTPETRTGPDGKPFPPLDVTRPWDSLSDDEKELFSRMAEVYAGFLGARRRPDRAAARLPRGVRLAREHARRPGLRQRRLGRGRPERLGQRDEVRERHPRHDRGQPAAARRARQPEDVQPLPERLGDGVQHAVQDVEALRVQRRHERPVHHLVAGRHRRPRARSASSTTTRSTSSRRSSTCSASRRRRRSRATSRADFDGVSMRSSFDDAKAPTERKTQFYSMLGSRGIWHDGWKAVTNHPTLERLEQLQRRRVGAVPHRRRPLRAAQPRGRAPREGPRAREPLVRRGRRERSVPARRPLGARDHDHAATRALAAAQPLHLLPGRRRRARVAGGERPQPFLRDRRARRHPGTGRTGCALRARLAVRRPRPLRQGQPAPLRLQLRRHVRAEDRWRPRTFRPAKA